LFIWQFSNIIQIYFQIRGSRQILLKKHSLFNSISIKRF
jgi:hypothetical protein